MTRTLVRGALLALLSCAPLHAQTVDDGIMMSKKTLCTGFLYGHDDWKDYWEGDLKRQNGNIGTITTENVTWTGTYGITNRLNVIAVVPYVWTNASQGVLHGTSGFQDLTAAVKYNALETALTSHGTLRAIFVASVGMPMSDYIADFQPLAIGVHAKDFSGRFTLNFQTKQGWFLNASGAYTWRGMVTLDRPGYFTDNQLFLTDQVAMPDMFDYRVSAGYLKGSLQAPISFSQHVTLGGGDIRRQDAPFISNRMNFSKVDALVMYSLPKVKSLAIRAMGAYTVDGRNVGQATTVTAGLLYTFHF
jgi:outer membrane putative beta-barrel porin/alpha-amylase